MSSTADGVSIDACITLRPKSKSLEFRTKVDWRASERFLKVDIPMAIQADRAQYECQYGMVERPIQKNTRSDEAKYESCTHRFVRVADAGYAAAVVNASTYGSDVSPIHRNTASGPVRGTMIRLSLLSSPLYPDPNTDKGVHEFAWNVVADASMPAVLDEANRLNAAVLPAVPAFDSLAQLNPVDGVMVLDWVKLADDGSGDLILRVYEAVGGEAMRDLPSTPLWGRSRYASVPLWRMRGWMPNCPRLLPTVIRPWQERARSDAEPASVPIGHVARQLWKRWWKY